MLGCNKLNCAGGHHGGSSNRGHCNFFFFVYLIWVDLCVYTHNFSLILWLYLCRSVWGWSHILCDPPTPKSIGLYVSFLLPKILPNWRWIYFFIKTVCYALCLFDIDPYSDPFLSEANFENLFGGSCSPASSSLPFSSMASLRTPAQVFRSGSVAWTPSYNSSHFHAT